MVSWWNWSSGAGRIRFRWRRADGKPMPTLDGAEQNWNNVLSLFQEFLMIRAVVVEAVALASLTLFLGMIAVWAHLIATL